ncbi:MAG: DNA/RNA nuclease SfsA [Lachnospiraceae bacterium]|nr:DNA/RNA nuclease SfsA [Lachnospiraceae bacterium]
MKYKNVVRGRFHSRENRFVAKVWIDGKLETVHVKNTGRCRELLLPEAEVVLNISENPARKTKYDLVSVYKDNLGWVNIDSQAPNRAMEEWLACREYTFVKPEYVFGDSRLDFYLERGGERFLMEVKGCTLEVDGTGYFPDAPTLRGIKHIRELAGAVKKGYHGILAFVIQMEGIYDVRPNVETHPEFGIALCQAMEEGVEVWLMECRVMEDALEIVKRRRMEKYHCHKKSGVIE